MAQNKVHLPDGRTLNLPPGMPQEQIQAFARQHVATTPVVGPVTPYGLPKAGTPPPTIPETDQEKANKMFGSNTLLRADRASTPSEALSLAIPVATAVMAPEVYAASGIAKAIPALAKLSPAVLTSLGFGVGDAAVRASQGKPAQLPEFLTSGNKTLDTTSDALLGAAINEITGGIISKGGRGLKGVLNETKPGETVFGNKGNKLTSLRDKVIQAFGVQQNPGSVVGEVQKYGPTLSQFPQKHHLIQGIEDVFAASRKRESIAESMKVAKTEAETELSRITGRKEKLGELGFGATKLQQLASESEAASRAASHLEAEEVKSIVASPKNISLDPYGNILAGKTDLPNTAQTIANLRRRIMATPGVSPDPKKQIFMDLKKATEDFGIKVDPVTGQIISYDPVSFETAWEAKKAWGERAFTKAGDPAQFPEVKYRDLYNAIDEDIQNSLSNLPDRGSQALKHYSNAKNIVKQYYDNYQSKGAGRDLWSLVTAERDLKGHANVVMDTPEELQRFLNTGNLKVPGTNRVINVTNAKREAQAYQANRLFEDAFDKSTGRINAGKLENAFDSYMKSDSGKKIFNGSDRKNIPSIIRNIKSIDTLPPNSSRYAWLRAGSVGLGLSSGLATSLLATGNLPLNQYTASGVAILGATMGAASFARLATNKSTARLLEGMAKGSPLEMSVQRAARLVGAALKHQTINFLTSDGSEIPAKIDGKGNVQEIVR